MGTLLAVLHSPVAHDTLLPHCAALVHHGGAGTAAAALRCGTQQLICPLHFDQHTWVGAEGGWGVERMLVCRAVLTGAASGCKRPTLH